MFFNKPLGLDGGYLEQGKILTMPLFPPVILTAFLLEDNDLFIPAVINHFALHGSPGHERLPDFHVDFAYIKMGGIPNTHVAVGQTTCLAAYAYFWGKRSFFN